MEAPKGESLTREWASGTGTVPARGRRGARGWDRDRRSSDIGRGTGTVSPGAREARREGVGLGQSQFRYRNRNCPDDVEADDVESPWRSSNSLSCCQGLPIGVHVIHLIYKIPPMTWTPDGIR